jgi:hypothetical protein
VTSLDQLISFFKTIGNGIDTGRMSSDPATGVCFGGSSRDDAATGGSNFSFPSVLRTAAHQVAHMNQSHHVDSSMKCNDTKGARIRVGPPQIYRDISGGYSYSMKSAHVVAAARRPS